MRIKLDDKYCIPNRAHETDAGLDLKTIKEVVLRVGGYETIHTGVYCEIPPGHFGLVVPRSGCGSKGFVLRNTVGIIDSAYRGEIMLMAANKGNDTLVLKKFERVAQLVIIPYTKVGLEVVESLDDTERGAKGFGDSGTH